MYFQKDAFGWRDRFYRIKIFPDVFDRGLPTLGQPRKSFVSFYHQRELRFTGK